MNYSPLSSETQENEDLPYRKLQTLKKKKQETEHLASILPFQAKKAHI